MYCFIPGYILGADAVPISPSYISVLCPVESISKLNPKKLQHLGNRN